MGAMPEAIARPVVALDIDGVVRVLPRFAYDELGIPVGYADIDPAITTPVEIALRPGEELHTAFHQVREGAHTLHIARGVPEWIRSLLARGIEVVWATTWMHHANSHIAPAIGVPKLPVAVELIPGHTFRGDSATWKLHQLATGFRGRPLIWVDDNPPYAEHSDHTATLASMREIKGDDTPCAFVETNPYAGATAQKRAVVDAWLERALTPSGLDELRREW